jgi:hypothetical protein
MAANARAPARVARIPHGCIERTAGSSDAGW